MAGGKVTCEAVGSTSVQGDAAFCHLLAKMGCTVEQTPTQTTVQVRYAPRIQHLSSCPNYSMSAAA